MSCFLKKGTSHLKVNRVFALREFGARAYGTNPTLAGPRNRSLRGRQKHRCLMVQSGAGKVGPKPELSEVLKPPGSRFCGRPSPDPLALPSAQLRQGSKSQGSGSCGSRRPRETGSLPNGVSFWAPPQVTLDTRLPLIGISELPLKVSGEGAVHPNLGLEKGCEPFPRRRVQDQRARRRGWGGRTGLCAVGMLLSP